MCVMEIEFESFGKIASAPVLLTAEPVIQLNLFNLLSLHHLFSLCLVSVPVSMCVCRSDDKFQE